MASVAKFAEALRLLLAAEEQTYVQHFKARVLQDALTSASVGYWLARAEAFEEAAPRGGKGEYRGNATAEQLWEARQRCTQTALACRRHAQLLREASEDISDEVWDVLGEVA